MKHKMWSRLLSMVLAVMMITSIVPTSAFAEAASEIAASSQAVAEVVEQTEEVTLPEDTTTEEPAAETPAQEPAAETPAEEPAGEPVPTAEPVAEPTAEPATESEQPTAEPTQAPAETAVPSEQPSAEPTAAPEGTETPEATAVPSATPAPSESPVPSETPAPSETPVPTEEPAIDGQALLDELMAIEDDEAFMKAVNELTEEQAAALEALGEEALAKYALRVETLTAQEETVEMNAEPKEFTTAVEGAEGVTVTVNVPAGALPVDAKLVAKLIEEETEEYNEVKQVLDNETPNELAESEEDAEQTGMIAMDIHFEVNGQEIEPKAAVQVTIDAQALLPENVDPETVAVKHLKEDENGEVAVETVADATEQTAGEVVVEEAQTEEPSVNMSTTFSVESFSNFIIEYGVAELKAQSSNNLQWYYKGQCYNFSDKAKLLLVDENKSEIGEYVTVKDNFEGDEVSFYDIVDSLLTQKGENLDKYEVSDFYLVRDDKRIEFGNAKYGNWYLWRNYEKDNYRFGMKALLERYGEPNQYIKNGDVYYIVLKKAEPVATVPTLDNNEMGITINLFNYKSSWANKKSNFDFIGDTTDNIEDLDQNNNHQASTEQGYAYQDILQDELSGSGIDKYTGYPSLTSEGNKSLDYLFNLTSDGAGKAVYSNVNHLFLEQTYNESGYFEYDSSKNFAEYFIKDGEASDETPIKAGNFAVYNKPTTAGGIAKFMPFNKINTEYKTSMDAYHFGMTIDFDMIQPKDGKVSHVKPDGTQTALEDMVFEFNGDDDLWVFIDGKLVLDLGGIHAPVTGTINFATGNVHVEATTENNSGVTTTLKEIFGSNNTYNGTFKNYTSHHVRIFYLERGAGGSNAHFKFNIPPVPAGTIQIGKEVTSSNIDFANVDFKFKLEIKGEGEKYTTYHGSYVVKSLEGDKVVNPNAKTDENGYITLRHGQYAEITDKDKILNTTVYRVKEIGAYDGKYEVTISESTSVIKGEEGEETVYSSEDLTAWETKRVVFRNKIDDNTTKYQLVIKKQMTAGQTADPNETFTVKITDEYDVAPNKLAYVLQKEDGTAIGTKITTDGTIKLQASQQAVIANLPWGSVFKVTEELTNAQLQVYESPVYEVASNGTLQEGSILDSSKGVNYAQGQFNDNIPDKEKNEAVVTITNTRQKGDLVITKIIDNSNSELNSNELNTLMSGISFTITKNNSEELKTVRPKISDWTPDQESYPTKYTFTYVIHNVDPATYTVTESGAGIDGKECKLSFRTKINAGEWSNSLTGEVQVQNVGDSAAVELTNTYAPANGRLKIYKNIDGQELGGGKDVFNFRIDKMDGSAVEQTWYMHVDGEGYAFVNGTEQENEKFIELPAGDYTVTELDNINYTFTSVSAKKGETNLRDSNTEDHSITVKVGDDEITEVTFINTPEPTNVPSDGSAVINGMQKINDNQFTLTFERKKELGQTVPQTTTSN